MRHPFAFLRLSGAIIASACSLCCCVPGPTYHSLTGTPNQGLARLLYGGVDPRAWHQRPSYAYPTPAYYWRPYTQMAPIPQTAPRQPSSIGAAKPAPKAKPKLPPPQTKLLVKKPSSASNVTATQMLAEVNVRTNFVSPSALKREQHPAMLPTYITIHSTGNPRMKAAEYASAMSRGLPSIRRVGATGAGRLSWHFTVDGSYVIQHLSTSVQGGHADFNGPGNKTSIGIEMCEYKSVSLDAVMDRTARLAAYLMWKHRIPLSHVVPHYHWSRPGMTPSHKACPHFLMDGGKPGPKWAAFKSRVSAHYRRLTSG